MSRLDNTATELRSFEYDKDLDSVKRIWREVGWVDDEDEVKQLDHFFAVGQTMVATINDEPECSVHIAEGSMRLQDTDLIACIVTAVTTSRIARGHAFAKRLTALQLQQAAQQGAAVAALGMFDQGYYDQLGFGTGGYDHRFILDPETLVVDHRVPTPRRLNSADYELMHSAMCARAKVHGSVDLHPAQLLQAEFGWSEKGFGLGYGSDDALTHFIWLEAKGERGPYSVNFMAYQNSSQLIELMGLLKSLADQVYSVQIIEPPEIQLQSLLARPFRSESLTKNSKHGAEHSSFAWWQARILDVASCVAAFSGVGEPVRFQLDVTDPVQALLPNLLPNEDGWQGVGGQYVVELGSNSSAVAGSDSNLPRLDCSVNSLTRMLWGVAKPTSLAITDSFSAPEGLLNALDLMLQLPTPHPGWDF